MRKVFLFSLCNGCYEYATAIIQAETLEEAVKKGKEGESYNQLLSSSENIQGYNFDYKKNINKIACLRYLNNFVYNSFNNVTARNEWAEKHPIFTKSYEEILSLFSEENARQLPWDLLSKERYLFTSYEFYDVMECMMPVPEGYTYCNGHSG